MAKQLNSRIPEGPVAEKWTNYKAHQRLVNPKNKLKLDIIVVGTGLAGASAAASLGEMGFNVLNFCIQDSPRRAHSIAAQGGINAAKNYQNDGDSVYRLFYDTVKGGDYRAREANVYRLAEVSNNIIDQCVAQGVPFAREYGGMLANRSFGGAQVSRTFYAKGQTGQQLLLGAYSSLSRQVEAGKVKLYTRYEMEDVVIVDGKARGIIAKNLVTGKLERFSANAVVIATGGYGNTYFLSTNAMGCNCTAAVQAFRKGAMMANPSYVQIHPTCIPVHGNNQSKLTLMSESLRNDGRIWVPKNIEDAKALQAGTKQGWEIPEEDRDYYLERRYPAFGNLVPRDVASRAAKERCDKGFGVNNTGLAVFLDFSESIQRLGIDEIRQRDPRLAQGGCHRAPMLRRSVRHHGLDRRCHLPDVCETTHFAAVELPLLTCIVEKEDLAPAAFPFVDAQRDVVEVLPETASAIDCQFQSDASYSDDFLSVLFEFHILPFHYIRNVPPPQDKNAFFYGTPSECVRN